MATHSIQTASNEPPNFWGRNGAARDPFYAATICYSGHEQANDLSGWPGPDQGFCALCSENVIAACPSCGRRLRGATRSIVVRPGSTPDFRIHRWNACEACGTPYPWGSREARIFYLRRLLRDPGVSDHDREILDDDLQRLSFVGVDEDQEAEGRVASAFKRGVFRLAPGVISEALGGIIGDTTLRAFQ